MGLYRYKVLLVDGTEKTSKTTAKTKEAAQIRVEKLNSVKEWRWIKEEKSPVTRVASKVLAAAKPMPVAKPALTPGKPVTAKAKSKLEKLMFFQSNKCFFCGRMLALAEASIEHLQPKSGGGNNADGNVVACCRTLNQAFGSISLKRKFEIVLQKAGKFTCPNGA